MYKRIVSLYPAATETLVALGVHNKIVGITIHDRSITKLFSTPVVGDYMYQNPNSIMELNPDCVILVPDQSKIRQILFKKGIKIIVLDAKNLSDAPIQIRELGRLVNKEEKAEEIIAEQEEFISLVKRKMQKLALNKNFKPYRTIRVMEFGRDKLLVPGDDSFQNEIIKNAGGTPPIFNKNGQFAEISGSDWQKFNPEVIYACYFEKESVFQRLKDKPFGNVNALKKGRYYTFSCDLTCRAGCHYGFFSFLLANTMYAKLFIKEENQIHKDCLKAYKNLDINLNYTGEAVLCDTYFLDCKSKSLILRFKTPQNILSSLYGWKNNQEAITNHSVFEESWPLLDALGEKNVNKRFAKMLNLDLKKVCCLYTGVNNANYALVRIEDDGIEVFAIVTAGVLSNAMRAVEDSGDCTEIGTINIIILTNRKMDKAAMTQCLIRTTEAKVAALEDLDIRSNFSYLPATGTGTDNVVIVSGEGKVAKMAGGHTKLGELVSKAVYKGVIEAIQKQNGIYKDRSVLSRLKERGIVLPKPLQDEESHRHAFLQEKIITNGEDEKKIRNALILDDAYRRGFLSGYNQSPLKKTLNDLEAKIKSS